MLHHSIRYIATLLVIILGDGIWLSFFAHAMFRPTLGSILLDNPRWWAAVFFYPLFAFGIVFFAVTPALHSHSLHDALLRGALLGLIAYATYDLTNLATIKAWTTTLALVDVGWGAFLTAIASAVSYIVVTNT
jgi:uncharacterized membrane protein